MQTEERTPAGTDACKVCPYNGTGRCSGKPGCEFMEFCAGVKSSTLDLAGDWLLGNLDSYVHMDTDNNRPAVDWTLVGRMKAGI